MLNAMGMMVGLVLARQRKVENPLVPALVAGMMPMPLGVVAAVALTDAGKKETPVPSAPVKSWFDRFQEAAKPYQAAKDQAEREKLREPLLLMQAERIELPLNADTRDFHIRLLAVLAPIADGYHGI